MLSRDWYLNLKESPFPSKDLPSLTSTGIIDCLTQYNSKKKVANFCKQMLWKTDTLSTVPPGAEAKAAPLQVSGKY